ETSQISSILMLLQQFVNKEYIFRKGDESISATEVRDAAVVAQLAAGKSAENLEQALSTIPDFLSFKTEVAKVLQACQGEIQKLQSRDSSIGDILQALDKLAESGWEFLLDTGDDVKLRKPQEIAAAM